MMATRSLMLLYRSIWLFRNAHYRRSMIKQRLHARNFQLPTPIYHSLVASMSLIGERKPLDLGVTSGVKFRAMTRIAHIIALAFLLATILGQTAGPAFAGDQSMDCCDPEMMQKMKGVHSKEGDDCTPDRECQGGDACCTPAITSIPALMPSVDVPSSRLRGADSVEMAVLTRPNSALVARLSEPPIA